MCELTAIWTENPTVKRKLAYSFLVMDGMTNGDGTGIICGDNIWKSQYSAPLLYRMLEVVNNTIKSREHPAYLHTRAASAGLKGVKSISVENSHPFQGDRFILMHNGVLSYAKSIPVGTADMTDSQFFLTMLEEKAVSMPDAEFPAIFNATMDDFRGKFAFIIKDKLTNKDYIIRGKSALLHFMPFFNSDGEQTGWVVNTQRSDIIYSLIMANNLLGYSITWDSKDIFEIATETIFEVDGIAGLKEVGKTKENFTIASQQAAGTAATGGQKTTQATSGTMTVQPTGGGSPSGVLGAASFGKPASKFLERMFDAGLVIEHIDLFVRTILGESLLFLTEDQWQFLDNICLEKVNEHITPEKVRVWKELITSVGNRDLKLYQNGAVTFPYFFETEPMLNKILDLYKEECARLQSPSKAFDSVFVNGEICLSLSADLTGGSGVPF